MHSKQKRIRTSGILKGTCDLLPPVRPYLFIAPSATNPFMNVALAKLVSSSTNHHSTPPSAGDQAFQSLYVESSLSRSDKVFGNGKL